MNRDIALSQWVQSVLYLNAKPFSLKSREYLLPIYDNGYKRILLKTGRQVEKSTTLAAYIIGLLTAYSHIAAVYAAPDDRKVRNFSHLKLAEFIIDSPPVKKFFYEGEGLLSNVYEKKFNNGSTLLLVNAGNVGNFRSPSGQILCLDEIQDFVPDYIPVAREILSHATDHESGIKIFFDTGTPLSLVNPIEELWRDSSMTEWLIPCRRCDTTKSTGSITGRVRYWNNIGVPNISPYGLICAKCGAKIFSPDGQWVNTNTMKNIRTMGFRISQPMTSWCDMEEIFYDKLKKYPMSKFQNEVLGISSDSATVMFPEKKLRECCDESFSLLDSPTKRTSQYPTMAGIDWGVGVDGGGLTVLTIGIAEQPTKIRMIYGRKFDNTIPQDDQTDIIIKKLKEFNVSIVLCDWGANGDRNAHLAAAIGRERIVQVQYVASVGFIKKAEEYLKMLRISRTLALSDLRRNVLKDKQFIFPRWEDFYPFAEDMMHEFIEEDKMGNLKYIHKLTQQDDALHSLTYLNLARKLYFDMPILHLTINEEPED